jgi:hypothetical protein
MGARSVWCHERKSAHYSITSLARASIVGGNVRLQVSERVFQSMSVSAGVNSSPGFYEPHAPSWLDRQARGFGDG